MRLPDSARLMSGVQTSIISQKRWRKLCSVDRSIRQATVICLKLVKAEMAHGLLLNLTPSCLTHSRAMEQYIIQLSALKTDPCWKNGLSEWTTSDSVHPAM